MKKYIITSLLLLNLFSTNLISQNNIIWIAFEDSTTGLYGFKDEQGNVKIEPKYLGFMMAQKFSDIIAVVEDNNESYYLLKNGRSIGRDSLYIFENSFDCESEGYIRFKDKRNNKAGMFNSEGKVVIPAEYNFLTKARNGLVVGIKGAKKEYKGNDSSDEHRAWIGGTQFLIDTNNNILVRDFYDYSVLDFYSSIIEDTPSTDSCRNSYLGIDGRYYTFDNTLKLFKAWLKNNFLEYLDKKSIAENAYPNLVYWDDDNGWISKKSVNFIEDNYALIKERISELKNDSADYFISTEDFIITPKGLEGEFDKYLDNCGNLKTSKYPLMDLVINRKTENKFSQDHFEFLKTNNGFKLLSISIRNEKLK